MDKSKDMIMMRSRELKRLQIIRKALDGEINQQEAAEVLRVSDRQVRRIVKRVRQEGERGVIHRSRGRKGKHRINERIRKKVLESYRRVYQGFGPTLAAEKMLEREKIKICDETLRLWLIEEDLWQVKRRHRVKKREWRQRKGHVGEMVQMDGSHHDWLEDRGPKLVLMGYIDDATGEVYGRFYEYEGTKPAMESLKRYIRRRGLPRSIYLDKHSTYKNNRKQTYQDWPFRDQEELTQFARGCQQLGIELIYANSPQAKGRVERLFGTLQDRLIKEMRLEKIKSLKEANEFLRRYLPKFNKKFKVMAKEVGDFHRSVDGIDLEDILSIQKEHVLRNDRTVMHQKRLYQVLNKTRATKVMVHDYLNGHMVIKHGHRRLTFRSIDHRPPKTIKGKVKVKRRCRTPKNDIWKTQFKLKGSLTN
ncbi:MAG: ISNCY family transposase [Desulfobacteraceae bacterium]|nr:ISNCY family transposase [Desulfobacteraceae bacterium]